MQRQKNYLTQEQIALLKQEAHDPIWRMGINIASLSRKNWWGILKVSGLGLIHFHGNQDTGWEHINRRHQFYSPAYYFGKGAHGNPSKFTQQSMPLEDYSNVADDVLFYGKIDKKEHPDGERFVKYVGKSSRYIGSNGEKKDFVLILYRETKIVHSIYPKKSLDGKSPKRILEDFARATNKIKAIWEPLNSLVKVFIPYINIEGIYRYIAVIKIDLETNNAIAFLEVYNPDGSPSFITDKLMEFTVNLSPSEVADSFERTRFINGLGIEDFSHLEKTILEIEREKFS